MVSIIIIDIEISSTLNIHSQEVKNIVNLGLSEEHKLNQSTQPHTILSIIIHFLKTFIFTFQMKPQPTIKDAQYK